MTTRKEVLIKKYIELQDQLKSHIKDNSLLPSLEDMDIADLLYYFSLYFYSDDIDWSLNNLFKIKFIFFDTDEEKKQVVEIIKPFVIWLKNLK